MTFIDCLPVTLSMIHVIIDGNQSVSLFFCVLQAQLVQQF